MLMNDYVSVDDAFGSYEQLRKSFAIRVPERFNFAFDVADRYAETEPDKRALVWCDDAGGERTFTFADLRRESNRTARFLQSLGVRKGDAVMLVLRRRYEFWFFLLALHKIGAIAVPATNMLHASDIVYRTNAAGIKVIVSLDDPVLQKEVDAALPDSPTLRHCVTVGAKRAGWVSFAECAALPDTFPRPSGVTPCGTRTLCCCISRPARRASRKWCSTTLPIRWGISPRRSTGRT
jgi:acetyl-CoA synthetase